MFSVFLLMMFFGLNLENIFGFYSYLEQNRSHCLEQFSQKDFYENTHGENKNIKKYNLTNKHLGQ